MSQSSSKPIYVWIWLIAIALGAVIATGLVRTSEQQALSDLNQVGEERLNLYASTLAAEYKRFHYLPFIVAHDQHVAQILTDPDHVESRVLVNHKLSRWQTKSAANALYLMNRHGVVVASSNWQSSSSFVGHDYHFRPYFRQAMAGNSGRFFAIGVTTGEPGLFLSYPVKIEDEIVGVAVAKINMSELEASWNAGGERVWVADGDGVIFLASHPQWRYRSISPLSSGVVEQIKAAQKYSDYPIDPLGLRELSTTDQGSRIIELKQSDLASTAATQTYLLHQRVIPQLGWTLFYLSDLKGLNQSRLNLIIISLLSTALLALVLCFAFSRFKHQQQLEWRVAQRTNALRQSNSKLKQEIEERIRTTHALRQTNEELVQAEKMGALGQLSAELVHEISQPLQAVQTFLASSKLLLARGEPQLVRDNLDEIDDLLRRVTSIITRLKTFASKPVGELKSVNVKQAIDHALQVVHPRLDRCEIRVNTERCEAEVVVLANDIKLEQVFVNLLSNAIDAIESPSVDRLGVITLSVYREQERAIIAVSDNGCGVDPQHQSKLFDSFFTTKPSGQGVGLGLSVSAGIVEEFGGKLSMTPNSIHGVTFTLTLNLANTKESSDG